MNQAMQALVHPCASLYCYQPNLPHSRMQSLSRHELAILSSSKYAFSARRSKSITAILDLEKDTSGMNVHTESKQLQEVVGDSMKSLNGKPRLQKRVSTSTEIGKPSEGNTSNLDSLPSNGGFSIEVDAVSEAELEESGFRSTRRTKIICTIGPAALCGFQQLESSDSGGINVARLNMCNGTQEWHRKVIRNVRQLIEEKGYAVAIMMDTKGSEVHMGDLGAAPSAREEVPCSILQQSWAKRICSGTKCLSKSVRRDASALTIMQVAINDLVKHALRFHLYFKTLQSHFREPEIFKSSAAHDWLKLIRLLHRNLKRKTVLVILGSVIAGMLIMVGVPVVSPNPVTWALTEENLIFLEAWRTIDRAYIDKTFNGQSWFRYREEALRHEPMNNREQTYTAIRKMLMTLEDPFTRFLEPEKFNTLRTGTRGAVTGVGLEVGFESNGANADLVVIAPAIGGPAERVGIVPGDIISEIDGMPTSGLGLYEAAQRLQGPESSEVKLTVQKKQSGSSNNIVLVREKIKINPVSWRLCEVVEGEKSVQIGYIRLATFNENASRSIKEAIQKLKESGATAYILDMRNNSGGLFPAGIEIAKMWLEKGVIVYITDSKGIRDIYEADGYGTIATDEPLAVLVNKGTASASEILAGALKDNKRATILGEPTFGKGKIQSVFELSDGSGMAVTVARYETPAHVDIDKVGITPDHSLPASAPLDKEDFCRCLIDRALPCYMPPSTFFPIQFNKRV